MFQILVINPGSTSTKIALFLDEECSIKQSLQHATEDLQKFDHIIQQLNYRLEQIENFLRDNKIELNQIDAFVGRGGLLHPITGGTYSVNEDMLTDLQSCQYGQHASNLGGMIAHNLANAVNKPAFIVDPVVVDELSDIARLSGHPEFPRKSIFHALNHKAVAKDAAKLLGKPYEETNLVVAHLGGGISVAAHKNGLVCDVNNALDGDGPFSPERSGSLPVGDLIRFCKQSNLPSTEILKMIKGQGGLVAYLHSNDIQQIKQKIADGDETAKLCFEAMAYQVSKEIGAMATVLQGQVDAIILTGGIAHDQDFVNYIVKSVSFIAPILKFPGEEEMQALAKGALAVLKNEQSVKTYRR